MALDLVFLWHMHQPDYRDHGSGEHVLPWVYLHALKDYTDMAAHLERHPGVRAVVNFVPVLLDQIEDYCRQFETGRFRDPLLRLLAEPDLDDLSATDRQLLLAACFRSNHSTMLTPFPRYQRLRDLQQLLTREGEAALGYLSGSYFADLLTWYHLVWCGESERRQQALLAELMSKGEGYSLEDRQQLLALIGRILKGLIPRYRALMERGQIEISTTPQTHPLAPLLLDFHAARETLPEAPLPLASEYPGGRSRVVAQIEQAWQSHQRHFGTSAQGMWPAEGAISTPLLPLLAASGCRWIASGQGVLNHSLASHVTHDVRAPYHPWHCPVAPELSLFFRDERLSDLVGFEYAKWHGRDAARHFIAQLEAILATAPTDETPVVSVILDGENAWEHYPYNAYYFFEDLYGLLEQHAEIRTTTYSELLGRPHPPSSTSLPGITAGSWVYGTLSTWIGDPEKNRAWDLLCSAKRSYDLILSSGRLSPAEQAAATTQLSICESSDWFWWFGDYNPQSAVASFDHLYRDNLRRLYRLLQLQPPAQLDVPISSGSGSAQGGTMRRVT
ncbi:glycoside hydrolase family 57 protein [Denitratisoma oestradiolicum]|uniref:Glycoside hydrolase family protein n=1 Tax=Denitratisoma oestradiolicum TaxID=311182 RepID=A0A6S6Y0E2_9PROT|nr:glycoside hydrolase family 57 protein [Denitratisoma oestradiolicum]TWO81774.1 glycoside hydrolase [Denitratisoma oestradiolicum]CAB1370733.1 Glycoside hydrolase family protein [Denitratisoma oestradiolicum]